jgi:ribosomal protein L44E
MAETLGSLCDKLTIVKLKQYHTDDETRLASLKQQEQQLQGEINGFLANAIAGNIPADQLIFSANKVFKKEGNETREIAGSIGEVFAELAKVNCDLWHEQEKVYEFEKVAPEQKDAVVKKLAVLNLERNKCIDAIDRQFQSFVTGKK